MSQTLNDFLSGVVLLHLGVEQDIGVLWMHMEYGMVV